MHLVTYLGQLPLTSYRQFQRVNRGLQEIKKISRPAPLYFFYLFYFLFASFLVLFEC